MRIVWWAMGHMAVRGVVYGVAAGALFGSAYGILGGSLAAMLFAVGYGMFLGGITGLILGNCDGLVIGVITRVFFAAYFDPTQYRRVVVATCAGVTFVVAQVLIIALLSWSNYDLGKFVFFLLPTFMAVGGATYAGQGFANCYVDENSLHDSQKVYR